MWSKTLVVRRGEDGFLFVLVLVPGDRAISWPKLRRLLGVSRLSMPDAEMPSQATGYERGTITPFGSARPWPMIADERVRGRKITLGASKHGLALAADADANPAGTRRVRGGHLRPRACYLSRQARLDAAHRYIDDRRQPTLSRPGAQLRVILPRGMISGQPGAPRPSAGDGMLSVL